MTLNQAVTVFHLGDAEGTGEHFAADTEVTLDAVDYLVMEPGVGGELRNDASEPATATASGLTPASPGGTGDATPAG